MATGAESSLNLPGGPPAVKSINADTTSAQTIVAGTNITSVLTSAGVTTINAATQSGGITQLTGDVTAGPGTGSQAATITNAVKSVAAVGATPNANGASIATTVLTLQPCSSSQPGVVTTAAQTLGAGVKTVQALTATQRILSGVVSPADGATTTCDASLGNVFRLSTTQNTNITVTNPVNGQCILIEIYAQSSNRTPTLDTGVFKGSAAISTTLPTITGNTFAILIAHYSITNARWCLIGYDDGFS